MKTNILTSKHVLTGLTACIALAAAPMVSAENHDDRDAPPSFTDDIRERVDEHRAAQEELVQERRDFAESLGDLSEEERSAAIEDFLAENADRTAAMRELGEWISEEMKGQAPEIDRPERQETEVADRPEVADDVQAMIDDFRSTREQLLQERRDAIEQYLEASQEDREQALGDLREQQKEAVDAQRELARSIRDEVANIRDDRRNN